MKIILLSAAGAVVLLLLIIILRAVIIAGKSMKTKPVPVRQVPDKAADNLSRLIQCRTVSFIEYSRFDMNEFARFEKELEACYPECHSRMLKEKPGDLSLLFKWEGTDPGLKPLLFLSHYDVVEARDKKWSVPPFEKNIRSGYIWGRGSQDMKGHLAALMEAVETLISEKFTPLRTVYFAFGGDEEVMGIKGAGILSRVLRERGLKFEFVFDEGGFISDTQLKSILRYPVALPGIAEKGLVSLSLVSRAEPGHSSRPGKKTAIASLARALTALEKRPFPFKFTYTTKEFFSALAPKSRPLYRLIFRNLWLFKPILLRVLTKDPSMASLFHTTQAITIISGGEQDNILPDKAEAVINYRILHGETIESVLERVRKITSPWEIEVSIREEFPPNEPIAAGPVKSACFQAFSKTIAEIYPNTITAPFLMPASTDSKQYADMSDQIYRFSPFQLSAEEMSTVHGIDERLSVDNLKNGVRFFIRFLENTAGV